MARSVTYNGITRFKPGGITKINADALNQVVQSANSTVALVGEAAGGAPGSEGLVTLFDSSRAKTLYRSGPLVDAIRLAFQSSGDPDVPGGASRVVVYKTNNSTQASLSLPSAEAAEEVSSTATGGSTSTLEDSTLTASTVDDQYNDMWLVFSPYTANTEVQRITDYDASTGTFTVANFSTAPTTEDYLVLQDSLELADAVDNATSTTTSVALKDATMTASEHVGRWVFIQNTASETFVRQITANTTSALTISPALPSAPLAGSFAEILPNVLDLSSKDYGTHTNGISVDVAAGTGDALVYTAEFEGLEEISDDVGGDFLMSLLFKGGFAVVSDTVDGTATSTTTSIPLTTGGLAPDQYAGFQVLINGEYTQITTHTASVLTVSPALSAAPEGADVVEIQSVSTATMEVSGAEGAATGLTVTTALTGGTPTVATFSFTEGETLRDLISEINADTNFVATAAAGVNADTTLVADLDFGAETEVSAMASADIADQGLTNNVNDAVNYFNQFSAYVEATRSTDSGSSYAGGVMPRVMAEFDGVQLTGGARGISTNTSFQNGMDELLKLRVNSVVPLIDQDLINEGYGSTATLASVAAQLADHVAQARGASQEIAGERGGFVGVQGTRSAVISQANALNDYDVAVVAQNPTALNASGSLQEFGPRILAVMAASMRAGVSEIGEPLTHKYLRVSGMTQDSSWDPNDLTDANTLIQNGVLFAETVDAGTRWVRDLTSWVKDDNLAYSEGSVRDIVRAVAYNLRHTLVSRYTGKKAKPATIASVKDTAVTYLELARSGSLIVDSTDPATGARVRAYHNLKVTSSGDVVSLNVGIFPVPGINFQLHDIFLQLPTQSA